MAQSKASERLRAPLMYAFRAASDAGDAKTALDIRDGDGERVIASRRSTATRRRALPESALRLLLADDLTGLLNTINLSSSAPELIEGLGAVEKSVLNYGLRDLADRTIDETLKIDAIREELTAALRDYEPRLLQHSLRIERDRDGEDDLTVRFVVRADMRADPVPASVEFVTEVERDTGEIRVGRL